MRLPEYVSEAKRSGKAPPKPLRTGETIETLVAEGMDAIRKDLAMARNLANAAVRTVRLRTHSDGRFAEREIGLAARLRGHCELLAGQAKKALPHYERAREAFRENPDERSATAVAMLQALAYVGEYQRAFTVGEEAIQYFESVGDRVRSARVRANLANAYHRLDQLQEARTEYEKALPVLAEAQLIGDLAIVMRNYGVCLMGLLDFSRAERLYSDARAVFQAAGQTSLVLEVDLNRAYLLGRMGRLREALVAYRSLREGLPSELSFEIGHCLLDQADFMLEAGLWSDALLVSTQAGDVFDRLKSQFELGKARLFEAQALIRLGRISEAQTKLAESRRRLRREPNRNWQALQLGATAELELELGHPEKAYRLWVQAEVSEPSQERLPALRERHQSLAIELGKPVQVEGLPAAWRAKWNRLRGNPSQAQSAAREALRVYDEERRQLGPARLRQAVAAAQESRLRECFRALVEPEERLAVVARLKNQALSETVLSPEAVALPGGSVGSNRDEIELEDRWRTALRTASPSLVEAIELPKMEPGQRFLELFRDQGRLHAFVIEADEVREEVLGSAEDFDRQSRFLRFHLARESAGVFVVLRWFSERLGDFIADSPEALIVGRDDPLSAFPLHALDAKNGPLIERTRVTYAPSASMYAAIRQRIVASSGKPLVLGYADERAPEIAAEARWVAEHLGTQPTRWEELAALAGGAPVLHLAAHGIVREDRPLFSAMQLGDREWSVFDVLQLRLRVQLTTLSGCVTGISLPGDTRDAEGFIEALLAGGSQSVLASFWQVADEPTRYFMESFYSAFRTETAGESHRLATIQTRERYSHPAFWAAFALFGQPTAKIDVSTWDVASL